MSIEAGVLVDLEGKPIYWHTPSDRSTAALPDSRDLWMVFWENRERISGFAHSHPGTGVPGPSGTDITTFDAIERALGMRLYWWIISEDRLVRCVRRLSDSSSWFVIDVNSFTPEWLTELRRLSYGA